MPFKYCSHGQGSGKGECTEPSQQFIQNLLSKTELYKQKVVHPQDSDGHTNPIQLIFQSPRVVLQEWLRMNTRKVFQVAGVQICNLAMHTTGNQHQEQFHIIPLKYPQSTLPASEGPYIPPEQNRLKPQKQSLWSCSNIAVVVDDLFFQFPSPQLQRWRCSLLQGKGCGPSQLSCCLTKSGHWDATCNNQRGWGWWIRKVQDNWWKQKRPHGDRNRQVSLTFSCCLCCSWPISPWSLVCISEIFWGEMGRAVSNNMFHLPRAYAFKTTIQYENEAGDKFEGYMSLPNPTGKHTHIHIYKTKQ